VVRGRLARLGVGVVRRTDAMRCDAMRCDAIRCGAALLLLASADGPRHDTRGHPERWAFATGQCRAGDLSERLNHMRSTVTLARGIGVGS